MVLTGWLDARTAPELEEEVDCLLQEGVTSVRIDLRQLDGLDAAGMEAVGALSARCSDDGRPLALIAASSAMGRELEARGASEVLGADAEEQDGYGTLRRCTSTVKEL